MAKVFDIEASGFWPEVTEVWCLVIEDTDTGEVQSYSDFDPDLPDLVEGLDELYNAPIIVGHNICGYDLMVLEYLKGWKPNRKTKIYDTWIMSMLCNQKRSHKHGLGGWGEHLGYPKDEWDDFSKYSRGQLKYCQKDVSINVKVYHILVEEAKAIIAKNPLFMTGLMVECEFARIEADIRGKGWLFNMPEAVKLLAKMNNRMTEIEDIMLPKIGMVCVAEDAKDEFKEPAWRKDGCYTVNTTKHFGYDIERGKSDRPILGPYCRVSFEQGQISSDKVLKSYLFSIGWVPDEYNVERINGKFVNKSPKLTESSLALLGEPGELIGEYNTLKNRRGILSGWIEAAERDGRLHGRMWTIGTPTFRCRHEVVANLPTVEAAYGKEMRSLLLCEEGWSIIGADSSGNQMRGLCHYIGNPEFTAEVIDGDVHTRNAVTLQEFTDGEPNRKKAKPFLYAFLFGASGGKLALILKGVRDATMGNKAKDKFADSIPGLKTLVEKLDNLYDRTCQAFGKNKGFIKGIDGRLVYSESKHKLLNYLVQTLEGITCKAAAVYLRNKLLDEGIPFYMPLHYHDELAVVVPDKYVDRVKELSIEAFTEAPKWFGVECMSGDAKSGKTYAEVH